MSSIAVVIVVSILFLVLLVSLIPAIVEANRRSREWETKMLREQEINDSLKMSEQWQRNRKAGEEKVRELVNQIVTPELRSETLRLIDLYPAGEFSGDFLVEKALEIIKAEQWCFDEEQKMLSNIAKHRQFNEQRLQETQHREALISRIKQAQGQGYDVCWRCNTVKPNRCSLCKRCTSCPDVWACDCCGRCDRCATSWGRFCSSCD